MQKIRLTYPQQNILLVEKVNKDLPINSIVGTIEINCNFNEKICIDAINHVIKNNDAMRINIVNVGDQNYQTVKEFEYKNFEVIDLSLYSESQIKEYINGCALLPLFFDKNELFEFKIFDYGGGKGAIFMKIHHIISDAWSCSKIGTQLIEYMEAKLNGEEVVDALKPSYMEFAQKEIEYENSEKFVKDEEFWREYLKDVKEALTIKNVTTSITKNAARYSVKLTNGENILINNYCKENRISPYALFLTALSTYLYRIKDNNDFVIGTPVLNRSNFREKNMVGMFVSTIPLRIKIEESEKFINLVKSISTNTLSLFRHQKYPYSKTLEYIYKNTDIKSNLYNVVLSYQNARTDIVDENVYSTSWVFNGYLEDQLQIHIMDMDDTGMLNINYDYLIDLFNEDEIKYLHTRIMAIIHNAIDNIEVDVENIRIMSVEEENKILYEFNDTNTEYPKDKTVIELFEEQVEKNPDKIAIVFEEKEITYKELNEKANKLANKLYSCLSDRNEINKNIGIMISKKLESIEMILAVLKNGLTFVPIDINFPEERIKNIVEIANINVCFCDCDDIKKIFANVYYIDNKIENESDKIAYNREFKDDLYVIFTSGSTGIPKGARIKNQNFVNLLYSQIKRDLVFLNKRVLQFATMAFDVSYQEIFSALCFGGTLVLLDDNTKKDSIKLTNYIDKYNIDTLFIPPAYLRLICEVGNNITILKNKLKDIIVAGEQLIITKGIYKLIKNSEIKLHNHYGPAETHVVATYTISNKNIDEIDKISIGKPINNTKLLILDKKERLLPISIMGEICIIGEAVGNGYISNKEITEKTFRKSKIFKNLMMYKTGDVGYFNKEGNVFFLGRKDFQVKVNGYRVEIEEIEKKLARLPYVSNAIIKVEKKSNNKNILIAILELIERVELNKIKSDLLKILPNYMIPNLFYKIEKMPLNKNGKIDRKSINLEKLENIVENKDKENIESLKDNNVNINIIKCIENTLNIKVNSNINFFDYGMDSLQAIKLQTELMKYKINLSIQDIYDNPTLYQLIDFAKYGKGEKVDYQLPEKTINKIKIRDKEIKNILLTGVTGYLGIHVLKSLLESNDKITVTCLTRKYNKESSIDRVKENIRYYFGQDCVDKYISRISVLESDVGFESFGLDKNVYKKLKNNTDVIINCAAIVSHYGNRENAIKSNLKSIRNIVDFVSGTDIIFNHISTIGVSGNGLVRNNNCIKNTFTEDDFYIGQEYKDNVYILTKTLGENIIYNNMNNINANVIRVGNLTNREKDYKFQKNYDKNAFQVKIGEIFKLGYVPKEILNDEFDISPVDVCADNIANVTLSNNYNAVYHIFNDKTIKFNEIIQIMKRVNNLDIKIVSIDEFKEKLFNKNIDEHSTLFQDILIQNSNCIKVENHITRERGYSIFNKINDEYYYNMFKQLWRNANEN